ncbi:protein CROWDED NUCLEI 4 [Syzygium oleosum]|uniref:protein CROWDED NUCLEI 4 n=1 Tax=Syzygium oleosum TaxID=219896 RepID=UPI0024B992B1|nr:protein CROWDED NUCLEI 4 [Syzygium oleosum]XP_056161130.1 protein CROWDED NUCLEI 4 [Syzygium oleosum]
MASPRPGRFAAAAVAASSGRAASPAPGSSRAQPQSPLGDQAIWRRLRDSGFDEESIKRRDKAALIAYIAKLEAEIFDHQHHMGLLILEQKELTSKYEQATASAEAAELKYKRNQAAHVSGLAEARKREEALRKSLGVEKECIASLEKALHEMRAESAETKVAAENKLSEAHSMVENAQKKFTEAEAKLQAAESLQAEANRYHRLAERKLQEVGAREDDLTRRILSFKSECDAKENEISLERQSLGERQRILEQGEKRLLDGQALLNQREGYIFTRSQELDQLEKELEASKANIEKQRGALYDEKSDLELRVASLVEREQDLLRKEVSLNKKEQELLVLQEKLASKESDDIQKVIANHEAVLRSRKAEFESEMEMKRKLVEDEIEAKQRACELREMDITHQEDQLREREHDLSIQIRSLMEKEKDVKERSDSLDAREKNLGSAEADFELRKDIQQKEKEEINKLKQDLQKSLDLLEDKKKQVDSAKDKLEVMKNETSELSVLEMKLKEELDRVRAEKLEVMAEADKLKLEKGKFESEWESIDEKREELKKDAERIAEERVAVAKFLKDERDSLRIEKDAMRNQYKHDVESLRLEREEFMNKMVQERSEWFSKIQQERVDFLLEIEVRKRELEDCIDKRREELESSLREKEKAFEEEKKNELQRISSLKEAAEKELDRVALEMKRLESERMEINLDRERRDREWAELQNSIEELKLQRQKLERQRELLHVDREEICTHIEQMNKLDDLKLALDRKAVEMQQSVSESRQMMISGKRRPKQLTAVNNNNSNLDDRVHEVGHVNGPNSPPFQKAGHSSSPSSAPFSWIRRYSDLLFRSSEKPHLACEKEPPASKNDERATPMVRQPDFLLRYDVQKHEEKKRLEGIPGMSRLEKHVGEEKTIFEVPTGGEDANEESEKKETTSHKSSESITEKGLQTRRKRRVKDLLQEDSVDIQPEERKSKKNKGMQDDDRADLSDLANTNHVNAGQPCIADVEDAPLSSRETRVVAEETTILVVDKVVNILVSSEKESLHQRVNEGNDDHLLEPVLKSNKDLLEGGSAGVEYVPGGNGVLTHKTASEGHDASAKADQIPRDEGLSKLDTHGEDG